MNRKADSKPQDHTAQNAWASAESKKKKSKYLISMENGPYKNKKYTGRQALDYIFYHDHSLVASCVFFDWYEGRMMRMRYAWVVTDAGAGVKPSIEPFNEKPDTPTRREIEEEAYWTFENENLPTEPDLY